MKQNLFPNFIFLNMKFNKYHYTDNRVGVPLYYLAYMLRGAAKIKSVNDAIYVKEGDVFFIPKNLGYQSYWYGNDEIEFLSCGFSSLLTDDDLNFKLQLIEASANIKQEICNIFSSEKALNCKSLSHFYNTMQMVLPVLKRKDENEETVITEKIKNCIENNPHSSLKEIAQLCAISESYMYAIFKRTTGTTPNHYKQKVLCDEGIQLLLTTNKTVEDITSIINFSSSSYFRKVLKKHTGATPNEIRKNRGF